MYELNTRLEDVGGGAKPKDVKRRIPQSQDSAGGTQPKVNTPKSTAEGIVPKSVAFTSNAQPHETNDVTSQEGYVGSDPSDFEPRSLSAIPLRWMMKEAIKSGGGILFDSERARRHRFAIPENHDNFPPDFDDTRFYLGAGAEAGGVAKHREPDVQSPHILLRKLLVRHCP